MMSKYQMTRNVRREANTKVGRFRGGKLAPVMAVAVKGSEGGMLSQTITLELDPIGGRMITPITGEMMAVFVPVQAIDAIKDPEAAYAGMTEVIREKLLSGNPLFTLEAEGEISKRCGIEPRSIGGVKQVNQAVRLAHNAAVNFLRTRKYDKAVKLLHTNTAITPALIGHTVLDRLNGVLDPDDRVNGSFDLQIPDMQLPVVGITRAGTTNHADNVADIDSTPSTVTLRGPNPAHVSLTFNSNIYAQLNGGDAGTVSLVDFYNAQNRDRLVRQMDQIIKDHAEHGEEAVLRWAHGLSVDTGKIPFVIAEESMFFQRNIIGATDSAGITGDVMRSDFMLQMAFTVPIPRTELGGIIITFATLKPDETLATQPHPILSDVWGLDNFVADELALDPVPVTGRELDSSIAAGLENTVYLYTGHNALKQMYMHYGFNRHLDPNTVDAKTAIWQLQVPMSVTPQSVLYPENLSHYPFADQLAEVCTYTIASMATIQTPMIFGPSPVENISVIGTENLFEQVE